MRGHNFSLVALVARSRRGGNSKPPTPPHRDQWAENVRPRLLFGGIVDVPIPDLDPHDYW